MPPLPKRHHYVPEFLIRNFRAEDNLVRFFDRDKAEDGIVPRNPTKVLFEPHLYTRTSADGQRDAELEAGYARLEDTVAPIVAWIVSATRESRSPQLTQHQKALWDRFIYEQWRRVPELHSSLLTPELFDQIRREAVATFESKYRPPTAEERAMLEDAEQLDRINQGALVGALAKPSENVLRVLAGRGLAVLRTSKLTKSFVLGSHPVVKLTPPGQANLEDHTVEMWLPVAPDVMVGLGRARGEELLLDAPDHFVRGFNEAVLRQSSKVVARSETLLRSLLRL